MTTWGNRGNGKLNPEGVEYETVLRVTVHARIIFNPSRVGIRHRSNPGFHPELFILYPCRVHCSCCKSVRKNITVLPSPFIKHCNEIDGGEVWEEGIHLIECSITVNGSLTINCYLSAAPAAGLFLDQSVME